MIRLATKTLPLHQVGVDDKYPSAAAATSTAFSAFSSTLFVFRSKCVFYMNPHACLLSTLSHILTHIFSHIDSHFISLPPQHIRPNTHTLSPSLPIGVDANYMDATTYEYIVTNYQSTLHQFEYFKALAVLDDSVSKMHFQYTLL